MLLRAEGAGAVSKVLEGAMPMVQLLWRRETEGKVFDSPERKAALDARLRDVLRQIQDPGLRRHYGDEIKELRFQLFRPQRPKRAFGGGGAGGPRRAWNAPAPPSASVKSSLLVAAGDTAENELREAVILAVLLSTPELIAEFEQGLEVLNCTDPVRASLRDVLLRNNADSAAALREEAEYRIGPEPLENLLAARHVAVVPCVRRPGDIELARMTVAEELSKITARSGAAAEIAEAEEDLEHLADEALTWRLAQAAKARNEAVLRKDEGEMDYDFGPNGARLDKDERDAFKALTEQIRFSKHGN